MTAIDTCMVFDTITTVRLIDLLNLMLLHLLLLH